MRWFIIQNNRIDINKLSTFHRISFVMNIFFLIFMAPIYSLDNVYLSVAWTILGLINGVYLLVKQRHGNTNTNNRM